MKLNMIKSVLAGSAFVALGLGATSAQAATNSVTANANAKILAAVTVTKSTDLNFGTAVSGAAAGTVAVSTGGAQTCTTVVCTGGGATAAGFAIQGTAGGNVAITVPATVSLTGPGTAMSATLTSSAASLVLTGVAATDVFQVGGSLPVAINQAGGSYTGTFTVSVAYQ
jgi:hypothetical protein